jgi:hypothetical protein
VTLFLPFWWSPRIYFIHMDEVMGGWRGVFLRVRFEREPMYGKCFGFRIRCAFGIGARERLRHT